MPSRASTAAFWERTGARKVGPQTLGEARAVMGEVLAAQQALQPLLKPSDNRLVPTSELEVREMDALKARLVRYLDFEAQLLPGFHPAHLEYEVGVHERVEYAGVRLVGKVDRIDVDDAGHAVVIDYKGSLSADYELAGDAAQAAGAGGAADGPEGAGAAADAAAGGAPCVPAKVQTLVYAQVVAACWGSTWWARCTCATGASRAWRAPTTRACWKRRTCRTCATRAAPACRRRRLVREPSGRHGTPRGARRCARFCPAR